MCKCSTVNTVLLLSSLVSEADQVTSFYTLAAEPEIASMLRDEVREVLAKTGGEFTAKGLQDMKKHDSFVKELLRFHPLQACKRSSNPCFVFVPLLMLSFAYIATSQRKVVQPITLSNGQVLPAGVIVEAPNAPVCGDAEIFEDPHVFDPLRFYKVRQAKDAANANSKRSDMVASSQLVGSSALSLTWGYGRHACPGRFFAANEIKMITGKVLMQYEIKLPDGVTERYPDLTFGDIVSFRVSPAAVEFD